MGGCSCGLISGISYNLSKKIEENYETTLRITNVQTKI